MIEILSSWAKGLGLAIVVVSILEMLLPNNKTKKYIRMVMGIYIIFNIISPLIQNKDAFDITSIDIENYTNSTTSETTYQTSMDERIKELYSDIPVSTKLKYKYDLYFIRDSLTKAYGVKFYSPIDYFLKLKGKIYEKF